MHRSEEDFATCADCGAVLAAGTAYSFSFGSSGGLCAECAIRRGGVYDSVDDRWSSEPSLEGLKHEFD